MFDKAVFDTASLLVHLVTDHTADVMTVAKSRKDGVPLPSPVPHQEFIEEVLDEHYDLLIEVMGQVLDLYDLVALNLSESVFVGWGEE